MIGDLFDDGSPSDTNTNTNTNINTSSTDSSVDNKGIHLSSSSSSGLLDFAVPPSSVVQPVNNDHDVQQDVGLVVNEEQPQPQPQQRQTSISLLGFSDSITANNNDNNNEAVESIPTIQHSPSVDLLGSHSPPPIQQQQQQPLDIFNTPVVAVSTTTNVMATKRDSFAPLDSSQQQQDQQSTLSNTVTSTTPTSATDNVDDPFGVFIQPTIPQLQQQLVGKLLLDPLSNISAPSTAPSGSGSGSGSIQPTLLSDPLVKETTTYTADKVADKKETSTMTTTANPVVTTKENNMDVSVNEVDDDDHNDNDNNGDDIEIKRQEVETPTKVLPPSTTTTTGMVIPPFEHQNSEEFVSISLLNVDDDHEEEEEEEEMKKQQNKGNSKSNTKTTEKVVEEESFPVLVPVYDRNNNNNNSNISSNKDEEKEYNSEKNDYKDDTPALPLLVSRSGNNDDKKEEQKQESIVVNTNSSTLTSSASASVEKGNPVGRRSSTSVPAVTGRFANFKNLAVGVAGHVQANVQVSQQRFQNVHVPQRFQNVQVSQRFSNVFGINNNKATTSNNDGNPTMAMETITNGNVVNNLSPSTTTATVNVSVTSEAISPSHNGNNDDNNNNNNNAIIRTTVEYGRGNNTEGSVVINYDDNDDKINNRNGDGDGEQYTIVRFNYTNPKTGEKYESDIIHHVILSKLYAGKQRYWYRIRVEEVEVKETNMSMIVPVVVPFFHPQYPHFFLRGSSYDDDFHSKWKATSSSTIILGETPVYGFSTPPNYGQPTSLAFVGDLGQTKNSTRTMARIVDVASATNIINKINNYNDDNDNDDDDDRVVTNLIIAGDLSYADGDPQRWESWLDLAEPLLRSLPFASVPGNHEIECDKITLDVFVLYESFFRNPNRIQNAIEFPPSQDYVDSLRSCVTPSEFLGRYDYGNAFYSYRQGLVHTVMLNSYTSILEGSYQRTWLTETALPSVDRSITPWLVVVFHTPLYTTFKSHVNEINPTLMKDSGMRQIFQTNKVNLVISGHDHAYMRTKPMNPKGTVASNRAAPIYWTLGAGGNREGHSKYINHMKENWVDVRDDDEFGFGLFFAANHTHAHLQWIRDDDSKDDNDSNNGATTSSVVIRDSFWIENYFYTDDDC
mmetsp:Transcript_6451/g.7474  ORF Transcript_6451/g.7474 Transcript_6451/m.7474 type:complete len:1124 (-) Transcript_6451:42-3413(-)